MESESQAQRKQMSRAQKLLLFEFVEENPDVIKHTFTNQHTSGLMNQKWQCLANKLNATPGASKNWKEWRKSWTDLKSRTKKKHSNNNKSFKQTGGGPADLEETTDIEDKIIEVLGGSIVVEGNKEILEAGIIEIENDIDETQEIFFIDENSMSTEPGMEEIPIEKEVDREVKIDELPQSFSEETSKKKSSNRIKPPARVSGKSKKKTNLNASIEAAENLKLYAKEKWQDKKAYYREKIIILKEHNELQDRIATALERIATNLSNNSRK